MTEEARETRWSALRIELQAVVAERDALAAENARLREAVIDLAGGPDGAKERLEDFWLYIEGWVIWSPKAPKFVPPHIVALQEAIYREGGE